MSYNGSGVFNINTSGQPVVTGTVISSTAFNALTADLATGLTTALTKDGQTTPTANIKLGGFKLTGIGVATTSGDALSYGQAATVSTLTNSALTSGRVTYASTAGLLVDSANLTFNGTTLTAATGANFATSSGNVGIGTTSPGAALEVNGQIITTQTTGWTGTSPRNTGGNYYFAVNDSTSSTFGANAAYAQVIQAPSGREIAFNIGVNTPKMTIDPTGNLNVGTTSTPAGSSALSRFLTVAGTNDGVLQVTRTSATAGGGAIASAAGPGMIFYTHTGTVASETYTERMRITSAGNVGIGTSSPGAKLHVNGGIYSGIASTTSGGLDMWSSSNDTQMGILNNGTEFKIYSTYNVSAGYKPINFYTSDALKMTLDASGNLLVGTTSALAKIASVFDGSTNNGCVLRTSTNASGTGFLYFQEDTNTCGSVIRVGTTSAVVYNTTSDYRLKTVIGSVTEQGSRIDALNPIDYKWKENNSQTRGFLAHEFQIIYPNSVTGEKDAVDFNGNPVYQGMQAGTAEVIADLVAELQSLRKRVAQLEGV